jgi:epoxide hydrolase-like predicted phosphatase
MFIKSLFISIFTSCTLCAAPQAIVFDFGGVMTGKPNREAVIDFLKETFSFTEREFNEVNRRKREAIRLGMTDTEFWITYANEQGTILSDAWVSAFHQVLKEAIGVNPEMYCLVEELKEKRMQVAMLSNIDTRLAGLVRDFGLYKPFEPCLLSCEFGYEKPDQRAYTILLGSLELDPSDVIFIDDRQENIDAAKQLGVDAILYESTALLREKLALRGVSFNRKNTSFTD